MLLYLLLPLVAIAMLMAPLIPVYAGITTGKKAKHAIWFNLCAFGGLTLLMLILPLGGFVSAAAADGVAGALSTGEGIKYLGAALATGLSCIGAGVAVGNAAPAAIGACSEDPKAFGKAMIFVVMGEGIAIYGLVISFMILFT